MGKSISPNPALSNINFRIFGYLRYLPLCCYLALFISGGLSCKGGKARMAVNDSLIPAKRHIADSLQTAHGIDSADYVALFKNKTNIWLYKMLGNKQAKWANFRLVAFWTNDTIKQYSYDPGPGVYKEYPMFLEWSPDSCFIVDNGSGSVKMGEPENMKWYRRLNDVEQKIVLIDTKNKKRAGLLNSCSNSGIWGSHWLDSVQVSLIGYQYPSENKNPDTLLWIINLKNWLFRKYKYRS